ncbi:MAG: hypothetical protein ABI181_12875 [Mycobacteriaceae bacterium]
MTDEVAEVAPTIVGFPDGDLEAVAQVSWVGRDDAGRLLLVADRTPFHPLDHTWPDQPADQGTVAFGGRTHCVADVATGAFDVGGGAAALRLGSDIPVRRGEAGWTFVAVHVIADPERAVDVPAVGDELALVVDGDYRLSLSAAHTACHLVALALNDSIVGLWSKTPRLDCLGHPDFDQSAITQSRITPWASTDHYRLGKSLRKSGFDRAGLVAGLDDVQDAVNRHLAQWIAVDGAIRIEREDEHLTARRWWTCDLPAGRARLACGGTHLHSTGSLGSVAVTLAATTDTFTVRTAVSPPPHRGGRRP